MVGSLRNQTSPPKPSPKTKGDKPRRTSSSRRHHEHHKMTDSSSSKPRGGKNGQTGGIEPEDSGQTPGTPLTSSNDGEQDNEDPDGDEPDAIASLSDPRPSTLTSQNAPVDVDDIQRVEGSETDQKAGQNNHSELSQQEPSPNAQVQDTDLSSATEAIEARSVSSGTPEPDFDVPDDDDDYADVDAVSQSSAGSEASEDSETFEKKEQDDFEIDWNDPATFDYESNTFTNQHRFSISDEDIFGKIESDFFPSPISQNASEQVFEGPGPDPGPVCGSVKSISSSSGRSQSADSSLTSRERGKSPASPHSSYAVSEVEDDDLTDECEYECGEHTNCGPISPDAITPKTPYKIKKSNKSARPGPPRRTQSFHRMPPRKRFPLRTDRLNVSTARGDKGRSLQYYWPKGVRINMIFGNTSGHLRPRRRVRNGPLKQVESQATPGMAEFIRSRLFQEHHCNSPLSLAARDPMSGVYRSSFYSFSSSFTLGFGSLPVLNPDAQIPSLEGFNETAGDLINFDETASEVGLLQDPSWQAFQIDQRPATVGPTTAHFSFPDTSDDVSAYFLFDEGVLDDHDVELAKLLQLAHDDEAAELSLPRPTGGSVSEQIEDAGHKRKIHEISESDEEKELPHKRRQHDSAEQLAD